MPRLLDLFCGVGGCSVGYARAGWDVEGVDLVRQPDYPFPFRIGNALTVDLDGYDAVHASPPCKAFTVLNHARPGQLFDPNVDYLAPMLARLRAWGGLWIVENVVGAPMPGDAVTLCGSAFGLRVRRHRLFAASIPLDAPPCDHVRQGPIVSVFGMSSGTDRGNTIRVSGTGAAEALGIDWTIDQSRLSQAIPPAYTEHVGRQLLAAIVEGAK